MAHQGTKMEPIPYTIALIKPDTAVNEERVNEILDKIEENGLTIYERETRILDREDALNLYAKFKHREFFQELCDYITSGPVEILLLTQHEGNPISIWKQIIGPSDPITAKQQAPTSLRALYGTSLTKNEFHGSDDNRQANRERDIFDLPVPVREPDFQYDKYKIALDTLLHFLYPPHLEHSDIVGRLDIFASYGPIVNWHSVDSGCFCRNCLRIGQRKLRERFGLSTIKGANKINDHPQRLLLEDDISELWPEFCENCQHHCENYSHLPGGRGGQHLLADLEINNLILEMNRADIEELLMAVKGSTGKTMMQTVDLTLPSDIQYTLDQVKILLKDLEVDYFDRMSFYDMQKVILKDRQSRLSYWISKITGKPIQQIPRAGIDVKELSEKELFPLSITQRPKNITSLTTKQDHSIVDLPKLGPNAQKVAQFKRLHRDSSQIASFQELNNIDIANNVFLLRDYVPGRHGGWDNYISLKGSSRRPKKQ